MMNFRLPNSELRSGRRADVSPTTPSGENLHKRNRTEFGCGCRVKCIARWHLRPDSFYWPKALATKRQRQRPLGDCSSQIRRRCLADGWCFFGCKQVVTRLIKSAAIDTKMIAEHVTAVLGGASVSFFIIRVE